MKKTIMLLALSAIIYGGCNKTKNTTTPASTPTPSVYCIYSGTVFLECDKVSSQDALNREQWYRDHGYTMMSITTKTNCSDC